MLSNNFSQRSCKNGSIGILELPVTDDSVMRLNGAASAILGFSVEETPGMPFGLLFHPDDLGDVLSSIHLIKKGRATSDRMEKRCRTKQGHFLRLELSLSIVPGDVGGSDVLVLIFQPAAGETTAERQRIECQETASMEFSFSFYEKSFNHNRNKLEEIRKIVIKDVRRLKRKLVLFEHKKDWNGIKDEVHRIRPILKKLECNQLIAELDSYAEHTFLTTDRKTISESSLPHIKTLLKHLSNLDYGSGVAKTSP